MKSIFTKLSALLCMGAVAMVGCTDFSADIREVNQKIEDLAASTATKAQVAELTSAIADLKNQIETQYATKEEVAAVVETIQQFQALYEQAKKDLEAAIDKKADKTELEAAVNSLSQVLEAAKAEFTAALEALATEDEAIKGALELINASIDELLASVETLQDDVEALQDDVEALATDLEDLQTAFEEYQTEIEAQFDALYESVNEMAEAITEQMNAIVEQMQEADEATAAAAAAQIAELQEAVAEANADLAELAALVAGGVDKEDVDAAKAELEAAIAALQKSLSADIKALEALVKAWEDHDTIYDDTELRTALANATAEYKSLVAELEAKIEALEEAVAGIQGAIDAVKSELRSVVLVPDMLFNGTKAVKFHRQDGKNVLKTFASVSYHFNPSNFDASTATYEIVAEQVEVMTKGVFTEDPAIEIVGKPVQENGKVTFELERGEGAGNMFALKVTLEDGTTIYSEYAAIIDEATFAVATATASFEVQRLAYEFPQLTSISAIIEYVQSLGQTVEDFSSTIQAINEAVKAMQNNDVASAIENLVSIPGLKKETMTITGVGTYRVQVETLDAAEIIEALQNAQTIDEIRKIIADLFSQAQGLGETGSAIIDGLNNALGGSGIDDLLGQYDNLKDFQLPDLILNYDKEVAKLDGYQAELDKARAEFQTLKDQMDAIISALDEATQAEVVALQAELDALNAEYAELEAQYEAAGGLDKIKLWDDMASVKTQIGIKEAAIIAKAGSEYFSVRAELFVKEGAVDTAEFLVALARQAVDVADQAVKKGEENLAKLETEILAKIKNYIFENTELGKYLTELENALGEQAWEAKKKVAAGTAQLFAIDALIADLIQNYNEANQQVVDEFANSLFGRVAYLIQTKEAEQAFEAIGLTELYTVLKQLPDLLTLIIKYYPAGVDLTDFTNFNDFGSIFSDYLTGLIPETKVEWELDYDLAK